jgi:diacylglycerol O-acyltransferase / wax synthase
MSGTSRSPCFGASPPARAGKRPEPAATDRLPSDTMTRRAIARSSASPQLAAGIRRVTGEVMHHVVAQRDLALRIPDRDIGVGTDLNRALARTQIVEAAKAVVKELKPVLGVDIPITGSPWLMTGLASLLGRSNLVSRFPQAGNVAISNVPGPPMTLYMAGAKMVHYFPVSIPYHGSALNITVQSYAGSLEFGLTACRRILSQDESYELIDHLHTALREIQALPTVAATSVAALVVPVPNEPSEASKKKKSAAVKPSEAAPQKPSAAN